MEIKKEFQDGAPRYEKNKRTKEQMVKCMTEKINVTSYGSSARDLEKIFDMTDEKRSKMAGIKRKLVMPDPEKGDTKIVRVLYYRNKDNTVSPYKTVKGDSFKNEAVFLNVEELDKLGVEIDMPLSKTLYQDIDKELHNASKTFDDVVGCIFAISAQYWFSAPKVNRSRTCPKCNGKGCDFCTVKGNKPDAGTKTGMCPPTTYTATLRIDMMTGSAGGTGVIKTVEI